MQRALNELPPQLTWRRRFPRLTLGAVRGAEASSLHVPTARADRRESAYRASASGKGAPRVALDPLRLGSTLRIADQV